MKELIEKIVERLQDLRDSNSNSAKGSWNRNDSLIFSHISHAFQQSIDIIQEEAEAYNDGWIPVSSGKLPEESNFYCVTTENIETGDRIEQTAWFAHKDDYDMDESEWRELYGYEKVIAWKKAAPYQPKGE